MKTNTTLPQSFTRILMKVLWGSAVYLVFPPIALFVILINIGIPHETAWHSVMSYLLVLGITTMTWVGLRKQMGALFTRRRVLTLAAIGAFTYGMNEMALEPLFPAGVIAFCFLGWQSLRGDRMSQIAILAAGVIVASATFHHIQFLDRFVSSRIQDRLVVAQQVAAEGKFEDTGSLGCMVGEYRFETCQKFSDEFVAGFTDTDWFIEFMDEIRAEQLNSGGIVAKHLRDRNDDLPVWGVSYDGDTWFIVGGHDSLYRDRVVPVMGLLWWWSFFVWGSLGATVIDWHSTVPPQRRRAEALSALYWSAGTAILTCATLICSSYLIEYLPSIPAGDYRPEDFKILQERLVEVGIAIPIAWTLMGIGLLIMHIVIIRLLRRTK